VPLWDRADLLARCKRYARRPATDASTADADWYRWMTEAEYEVMQDIADRAPESLWSAPFQMTAGTGNKTYTFGNDANGQAMAPMRCEVYRSRVDVPDFPLTEGVDYLWEGNTIRIPYDQGRTFVNGAPWARVVAPPIEITALQGPTLRPLHARTLIVLGAVARWASEGGYRDNSYWEAKLAAEKRRWYATLRNMVRTQGTGQTGAEPVRWQDSPDLGA
jgi:hypothetical protein